MGESSANTEVTICLVLCDQSVESVTPPHPVWSDLTGGTVTQLNMVVIGGPDGLNS